jgi:hypothetical protein
VGSNPTLTARIFNWLFISPPKWSLPCTRGNRKLFPLIISAVSFNGDYLGIFSEHERVVTGICVRRMQETSEIRVGFDGHSVRPAVPTGSRAVVVVARYNRRSKALLRLHRKVNVCIFRTVGRRANRCRQAKSYESILVHIPILQPKHFILKCSRTVYVPTC